ncbi:G-PROTEIN-RECEP-F1-2 domain-containing protein [Aphelenchoides bicaudatus]|nr:G-PROTEIN-RECEP-F1-2 domain-containing protein [Aphelenchoides bicaudatus]
MLQLFLVFMEISAWTAGVSSYAYLGVNRCVAICLYSTKAKVFNRVFSALVASISTWIIGITVACIGTFPGPKWLGYVVNKFYANKRRASSKLCDCDLMHQCGFDSTPVDLLNTCIAENSTSKAENQQEQAEPKQCKSFPKASETTFQFFYPSLLCTISSILYFTKPYIREMLTDRYLIAFHILFLLHRIANPFIYSFFNDRMRITYFDIMTCSTCRYQIRKRRKQRGFQRQNSRATMSRKSHGQRSNRMSTKSTKWNRDGIVRSSLQAQSRDFEQLCEFMMRVNPLYDSSEGWRESSDNEDECDHFPMETRSEQTNMHRESRAVLDLGRQTLEHWAKFAKKASI